MPRVRLGLAAALPLVLACFVLGDVPDAPPTPKKAVTDTYHGVQVTDEYRWLEDSGDPAVQKWVKSQNRYARHYLDRLPARAKLMARLKALLKNESPRYEKVTRGKDGLFALKDDVLVWMQSPDDTEPKTVVDPDEALPEKNAAIDLFIPSPDDKKVAVSLSVEGREEGTLYVYETETGKKLPDRVPRVVTSSGGALAWKADGSGFYYTRNRPADGDDKCRQPLYVHKLGTPVADDEPVFGEDLPRLAGIALDSSDDNRWLLVAVARGTGREYALHLLGPSGKWVQVCRQEDQVTGARFGPKGGLYLVSEKDAPRGKVLMVPLDNPSLAAAKTVLPQGEGVVRDLEITDSRLVVVDAVEGAARMRTFDLTGKDEKAVPLRPMSAVPELLRLDGEEVLFANETYLQPPQWVMLNAATGKRKRTKMSAADPGLFADCEVVRELATAADGVKIPMTILRRKGTRHDGKNPTRLFGYGGYGENDGPQYQVSRRIWLDQGGVFAVAHTRGSGEYGAEWRRAGQLTRKQTVYDDFAACARHLIARQYASPEKLAVEGGSHGGLVMGAALTQHPELFAAVVAHVGIYDMLRIERHPNGFYSSAEFGSVKDAEQFRAMLAYSPFHRVKDGTAYPAVFLRAGANDNRVPPCQTWKMAARLQAATSSGRPVLLWTDPASGHDTAGTEQLRETVDVLAFLLHELGVTYRAPKEEPDADADRGVLLPAAR